MSDGVKGFLIILLWLFIPASIVAALLVLTDTFNAFNWILLPIGIFSLLYGFESGILTIYNLNKFKGWVEIIIDMTWSIPNTLFGFIFGNLIYIFFANPSRKDSKNEGWIVFNPRSSTGFGNKILQVLGTINLGGPGQHEKLHLLQARIFGPFFLPLYIIFYVVNFLIQFLWTMTIGWILWLCKVLDKPYFTPPKRSVVGGFFGWIYYYTPFELWGYHAGNP